MAGQELEIKQEIERKINEESLKLLLACSDGDLKAVREALSAGADVNAVDFSSKTPLMLAVVGGHREIVELLLKQPKIDLHKLEQDGASALALSLNGWSSEPNYQIARLLIQAGADINQVGFHSTLLLAAWYKGNQEAARALIRLGADIEKSERLFRDDLYASQNYGFLGAPAQIELSKKYRTESVEQAKAVGWEIGRYCVELPEDAAISTAEILFGTNMQGPSLPARELRSCLFGYKLYNSSRQKEQDSWEAWKKRYNQKHPNHEKNGYGPGALITRPSK